MYPTLGDISKKARVSVATASRVVNGKPVSAKLRERVLEAMRELNYEKRPYTKSISASRVVGLVMRDIKHPYAVDLTKGIENSAARRGYNVMICDAAYDPEAERRFVDHLLGIGVRGVIVVPSSSENAAHAAKAAEGYPVVFLDRYVEFDRYVGVTADNFDGAYQAAKYLINLGHRDIVYLAGKKNYYVDVERYRGFVQAHEEAGLAMREDLVIYGGFQYGTAFQEVSTLVEKGIAFTAVFGMMDRMAFGAYNALRELGKRVPEDVSLMGYGDVFPAAELSMTTVAQPSVEMGRNALISLIELIEGRLRPPHRIVLRPSLVIRETCGRRSPPH